MPGIISQTRTIAADTKSGTITFVLSQLGGAFNVFLHIVALLPLDYRIMCTVQASADVPSNWYVRY